MPWVAYLARWLPVQVSGLFLPPPWVRRAVLGLSRFGSRRAPRRWPYRAVAPLLPDTAGAWERRVRTAAHEGWLMACGPRLSRSDLARTVAVRGLGHLEQALTGGKGTLVVIVHQVGLRTVAWAAGQAGAPVYWVGDPPGPGLGGLARRLRYWQHQRWLGPGSILLAGRSGTRRIHRRLKTGAIVCMAQDVPGDRYEVPFMGGQVKMALGVVRIAGAAGTPLVPGWVVPSPAGLAVENGPPLAPGDRECHLARAMAALLEQEVCAAPELWSPMFGVPPGADPKEDTTT